MSQRRRPAFVIVRKDIKLSTERVELWPSWCRAVHLRQSWAALPMPTEWGCHAEPAADGFTPWADRMRNFAVRLV